MKNKTKLSVSNQSGYVIAIMPFVIMAMLAMLGLVVDSSNLYAAKVKAGAAAEIGVLSATGARIIERSVSERQSFLGTNGTANEKAYLATRFNESARNNLQKNNVVTDRDRTNFYTTHLANDPSTDFDFVPDAARSSVQFTGRVTLSVPLFFYGVYKFFGSGPGGHDSETPGQNGSGVMKAVNLVTGSATTEIRGSAFVFLVDVSSSQGCPAVGACLCNTVQRNSAAVGGSCRQEALNLQGAGQGDGSVRIEKIVAATNKIVTGSDTGNAATPLGLDPLRDRIAIIIYNNSAQVLLPFDNDPLNPLTPGGIVKPGFSVAAASAQINRLKASDRVGALADAIVPSGNTNISDALITARDEINRVGLFQNAADMRGRINVILLSEGAATAMRVLPENGRLSGNAPGNNDPDGLPVPAGDYINTQLTMQVSPGVFVETAGPMMKTLPYKQFVSVKGGKPLLKAPMLPLSQDSATGYPENVLPPCHLDGATAKIDLFSNDIAKRQSALEACLGSTWKTRAASATDPDKGFNSGSFTVGDSLKNDAAGSSNLIDFRTMYYLATLRAVETLNDSGVKMFTLSWGELEPRDPSKLFKLASVSNVKMDVLANLSNDPFSTELNKKNDPWTDNANVTRLFGDKRRGFRGRESRGVAQGASYRAIDSKGFEQLFNDIILQAKLSVLAVK